MADVIQFTQGQAHDAKYWYERIPYTYGPATVANGRTAVVNVTGINKTRVPRWLARLQGVAATQNANVGVEATYDSANLPSLADQQFTDGYPAGVRALRNLDLPARDRLVLRLNNTSGGNVNSYQLNYTIAMQRLTLAEKLLRGITDLTPEEQEALEKTDVADLVEKGIAPIPIEAQIERTYRNRILASVERTFTVDVTATDAIFHTIRASEGGPDSFIILRELAVEGASAIRLSVDRDDDANYIVVAGDAFVDGDDAPWDLFVPALDYLTFHAQAAGNVNNVAIRIGYWHVRMSNLLRVRFGLVGKGEVPDSTYYRAIAGVA